jgi:hypothetical protein
MYLNSIKDIEMQHSFFKTMSQCVPLLSILKFHFLNAFSVRILMHMVLLYCDICGVWPVFEWVIPPITFVPIRVWVMWLHGNGCTYYLPLQLFLGILLVMLTCSMCLITTVQGHLCLFPLYCVAFVGSCTPKWQS